MSPCSSPPTVTLSPQTDSSQCVRKSLFSDCIEEENRHKWIESEKAGYDLGEGCVRQWVSEHWQVYLRAKWVEHLQGKCFWIELDRGDFGLLQREFRDCPQLLDLILVRLKSGQENLHLLAYAIWACHDQFPTGRMIEILESIDINSRRLAHRFDFSAHTILTLSPGDLSRREPPSDTTPSR